AARQLTQLDDLEFERDWGTAMREIVQAEKGLPQKAEVQSLHGALLHLRFLRGGPRAAAEEANTHYLLALDLGQENPRYCAMVLEQLGLLHVAVGNFRIAIGHLDERSRLPFASPEVELAHHIARARALLHVNRDADAAAAARAAVEVVDRTPA